jgi:hypothetical protein
LAWTLKSDGLHRYSRKELRVFKLMPNGGKRIDTCDLLAKYYEGAQAPLNGQVSINGAMRSLMEKVKRNNEPFTICKSERRGPHPMEYWIEAK